MPHRLEESIGFHQSSISVPSRTRLLEFVNLKLAARGFAMPATEDASPLMDFGRSLLANFEEKFRLLGDTLCPADQAIHDFLADYLKDDLVGVFEKGQPLVPAGALILERHGLAL